MSEILTGSAVTPEAIDYLLGLGVDPLLSLTDSFTSAPPQVRSVVRVSGRAVRSKDAMPRDATQEGKRSAASELVTALATAGIPFAYKVEGDTSGVRLEYGLWGEQVGSPDPTALLSALSASYLVPQTESMASSKPVAWPRAGLALGVPKAPEVDTGDHSNGTDRLIRALGGRKWAVLVLAEPVTSERITDLRNLLINDQRTAAAEEAAQRVASPLGQHYQELIKRRVHSLTGALSQGGWRVGVYLLGDDAGYQALASVWRGLYSSIDSAADPVRVVDCDEASGWAARWALPDSEGAEGPCFYRHPFAAQTVMSSAELAAIVELPAHEVPGFTVSVAAEFDVVPPPNAEPTIELGPVLFGKEKTTPYRLGLHSLTQHALVAGTTGAGKTNTIFHLLGEVAQHGTHFLVLEPAKTEYRDLLSVPELANSLTVYTVGDERFAPFRMNPFEPPTGAPIAAHIDLLRSAFEASFGMWTPLPQVLERCLHAIYTDYGWDLRSNSNHRLGANDHRAEAFPTLTDLARKVEEVVPTLGYEERVEGDIRAALVTRLEGLRTGSKGALLDTRDAPSAEELFSKSVVLELEHMGHDDDRALLMALVLIRLVEWRRTQKERQELQHLLVIEEAHRLLTPAPARSSEESGDARGEAVRTFSNLLAEIRAYGQGVIIADQVPARLIPEVMKNTNLKIGHRIVAADDQQMLARTMALSDTQARALTIFERGEAAVFSEQADAALRVRFPPARFKAEHVSDEEVAAAAQSGGRVKFGTEPFCVDTCASSAVCDAARRIIGERSVQRVFARMALSLVEEATSLDRLWPDLTSTLRAVQPEMAEENEIVRSVCAHAAAGYARRRGAQGAWSFDTVEEVSSLLRAALLEKATEPETTGDSALRRAFQARMRELATRRFSPFVSCARICRQNPPLCLYRHDVADLIGEGGHAERWDEAEKADLGENGYTNQWQLAKDAAYRLIEFPEVDVPDDVKVDVADAANRVAGCYAQHMVTSKYGDTPRRLAREINAIVATAAIA